MEPRTRLVVRLPERGLADSILHLAAPLLSALEPAPTIEAERHAIDLAIRVWNAHVAASKLWGKPSQKALKELRTSMGSRQDRATLEQLGERWREAFMFDPRLVGTWTYELDDQGRSHLTCETTLPKRVHAEVLPPIEKRIAIGGRFLDEVQIRTSGSSYLGFPVERHRAVVDADGGATVFAQMPSVLQMFAEGRLSRVGGDPVEVMIGRRELGPMVLVEVRCTDELGRHDIAVLVFRQAPARVAR